MWSTLCFFFFFNDTATTEIYTLSLHDALPIYLRRDVVEHGDPRGRRSRRRAQVVAGIVHQHDEIVAPGPERGARSEEHTSELQSPCNLVCRLLLEKKKKDIASRRESLITLVNI